MTNVRVNAASKKVAKAVAHSRAKNSNFLAINGAKPSSPQFITFGRPAISNEEINEVIDTLKSGWIGTGPKTRKFEGNFAEYKQAQHAVALNSCTSALHLSLLALNLKAGDEVITTPMTFCATANAILNANAKPIFVDCNPYTLNIDPNKISAALTKRTKAILPVHFAGRPCDMDTIVSIAKKHKLAIVEDCAHAIETQWNNQAAGTFGDFGCFSFYVTKNLTTGDGGMVLCKRQKDADLIRILSTQGLDKNAYNRYREKEFHHYQVVTRGYKANMTDIEASLGLHQLARIEENHARREIIWNQYQKAFRELPIIQQSPLEKGSRHAYHLYTVQLNLSELNATRDKICKALEAENIGIGIHYLSLHLQPYMKKMFGFKAKDFENAHLVSQRILSLPLSPDLSDTEVNSIVTGFTKVLQYYAK